MTGTYDNDNDLTGAVEADVDDDIMLDEDHDIERSNASDPDDAEDLDDRLEE